MNIVTCILHDERKLDLTSSSREYSLRAVVAMKARNLIQANMSFLDLFLFISIIFSQLYHVKIHQIFSTRATHCSNHDGWCVLSALSSFTNCLLPKDLRFGKK